MSNILVFAAILIIALFLYFIFSVRRVSDRLSQSVLQQLAKGCTYRMRGMMREDSTSIDDISGFMTGGNNRVVVITNIVPEEFIKKVQNYQTAELKMVAISSSIVKNVKSYIVMAAGNGKLSPIGAPTGDFTEAANYLESAARSRVGPEGNNLVFFIDEDIPCPEESPAPKEACCGGGGRRYY